MKSLIIGSVGLAVLATSLTAQKSVIYPRDHTKREGYSYQTNVHVGYGVSRVQFSYEDWNLDLPKGAKVTAFGYRQDGGWALKSYKIQFEAYMFPCFFVSKILKQPFADYLVYFHSLHWRINS